jgi:hypothetical protein
MERRDLLKGAIVSILYGPRTWGHNPHGNGLAPTVATPTFSPASGTYSGSQTVTLSDATSGASIYYTTDNSTPTYPITGTTALYSSPIIVSSTETIKAIGVKSGMTTSAVGSAAYTISGTIAFDYYISPTGDDTLGNGSLGNPWSITALNALGSSSQASHYAGKKVGIIGDIGATLSGFAWTGTGGQFSCNANTLTVGMYCMISGTAGGGGSLSGYVSGNVYYMSVTNGTTTGTLTTKGGSQAQALVTTAGSPTGLTFALNQPILYGTNNGTKSTLISLMNASGGNVTINIQGGTSASNLTYLASCNSSGVYTPRWAVIDATDGNGNFSTNNVTGGLLLGQSSQSSSIPSQPGYITYDGLGVRGFTFSAITANYDAQGAQVNNVIIENCEIYNGLCGSSSNNPGAIRYRNCNGIVISNNKIYDLRMTSGAGGSSPVWGLSAIMAYGQSSTTIDRTVITNNTTYNCPSILQKDQCADFANCSYNYLDHGQFGSAANSDSDLGVGSIVAQQPASGATSNIHHNIMLGCCFFYPQSGTNYALGTYNLYNNTFYGTQNYSGFVVLEVSTGNGGSPPTPPGGACAVQFQNNISWAAVSYGDLGNGSGPFFIISPQFNIAGSTFNANVYSSAQNFSRTYGSNETLASWQAATGCDSTSVSISSTPFVSTPQALVPSSFATNSSAIIGGVVCGALDGSGPIGCNFSNVQ